MHLCVNTKGTTLVRGVHFSPSLSHIYTHVTHECVCVHWGTACLSILNSHRSCMPSNPLLHALSRFVGRKNRPFHIAIQTQAHTDSAYKSPLIILDMSKSWLCFASPPVLSGAAVDQRVRSTLRVVTTTLTPFLTTLHSVATPPLANHIGPNPNWRSVCVTWVFAQVFHWKSMHDLCSNLS